MNNYFVVIQLKKIDHNSRYKTRANTRNKEVEPRFFFFDDQSPPSISRARASAEAYAMGSNQRRIASFRAGEYGGKTYPGVVYD